MYRTSYTFDEISHILNCNASSNCSPTMKSKHGMYVLEGRLFMFRESYSYMKVAYGDVLVTVEPADVFLRDGCKA